MADPTPAPGGDLGEIVRQFAELRRRVGDLEAPSGTQRYQSVEKLSALIDDIQATLTDFIQNDVNTIVDQRIAIALGSYFSGNISIGGSLVVNGAVQFPGARATPLGTAPNRVAAWLAGPGDARLGHTA